MAKLHPEAPAEVKRMLVRHRRELNAALRQQMQAAGLDSEHQRTVKMLLDAAAQTQSLAIRRVYAA